MEVRSVRWGWAEPERAAASSLGAWTVSGLRFQSPAAFLRSKGHKDQK